MYKIRFVFISLFFLLPGCVMDADQGALIREDRTVEIRKECAGKPLSRTSVLFGPRKNYISTAIDGGYCYIESSDAPVSEKDFWQSLNSQQRLQTQLIIERLCPDDLRRCYFSYKDFELLTTYVVVKCRRNDIELEIPVYLFNSEFGFVVDPQRLRDYEAGFHLTSKQATAVANSDGYSDLHGQFIELQQDKTNPEFTDIRVIDLAERVRQRQVTNVR